jgi:hypothetical protein
MKWFGFAWFVLLMSSAVRGDNGGPWEATVGMRGRAVQIVLPGSELEAKPLEDSRVSVVLRIAAVYPHGTAHRYDLEFYGLDPGTYDLRDYLRRKDGSVMDDVPPLKLVVHSVLPAGQILPHELAPSRSPWLGGYRLALIVAGVLWFVGLLAILFVGRRKKRDDAESAKPLTVADRLRPLIESGLAGKLTQSQRAELERTLLAFRRRKLRLEEVKPAEAMARMRSHSDASQLLDQLDKWLHRPGHNSNVDVDTLLRPYQNVPNSVEEVVAK